MPKSIDCLYIKEGTLYLVEFKNKFKIARGDYLDDIKPKIHDSLSSLNHFYKLNESDFQQIEIIIVHKAKKSISKSVSHERLNKKSASSCPNPLIFLQNVYRIKISKMTSDEFFQKIQK